MNPHTATLDEIRDWLAREDGYGLPGDRGVIYDGTSVTLAKFHKKEHNGRIVLCDEHPHPPTLDGAASAMPEGWSIKIVTHNGNCQATAWPSRLDRLPSVHSPYNPMVRFHEASTEIEARYRLAALCRLAEKEGRA